MRTCSRSKEFHAAEYRRENRWLPAKGAEAVGQRISRADLRRQLPTDACLRRSEQSFLFDWTDGYLSEDMLKLNIWFLELERGADGDGLFSWRWFQFWLGVWSLSHEARMARHHDVVQVSVNHQLNLLGLICRRLAGTRTRDSVNVGMTDLVAALQWILRTSPISAAIRTR